VKKKSLKAAKIGEKSAQATYVAQFPHLDVGIGQEKEWKFGMKMGNRKGRFLVLFSQSVRLHRLHP
jgi:hypothetical protein